ncbi:hypothetical protein BS78_07G232200 [Paspalum vaginatum]|nr:hypothetical protein BS78_07G232200 [Paspalum vaginatum]
MPSPCPCPVPLFLVPRKVSSLPSWLFQFAHHLHPGRWSGSVGVPTQAVDPGHPGSPSSFLLAYGLRCLANVRLAAGSKCLGGVRWGRPGWDVCLSGPGMSGPFQALQGMFCLYVPSSEENSITVYVKLLEHCSIFCMIGIARLNGQCSTAWENLFCWLHLWRQIGPKLMYA